ncbi:hypothetical protein [Campylobacter sp. RM16190]|uniref:hypothetical protein n=1 Tax=Campylobacter sp. RM16190 TaxID=1705727 RepID=UPI0014758B6B|nr:hypothetical protein [Campylobacter sp. RM16190]
MNDEIIVFKKSDLKSILSETIQSELAKKLSSFEALIKKLAVKKDLPEWVKGDKQAGGLIGISGQGMAKRRNSGVYKEGVDFTKKSGRILYRTDALLNLKE